MPSNEIMTSLPSLPSSDPIIVDDISDADIDFRVD